MATKTEAPTCPRCGDDETRIIPAKPPADGPDRHVCDSCGASWLVGESIEAAEEREVTAAAWAAIRRIAEKELDRSALVEGATYDLTLALAGNLGLIPFCRCSKATVRVGYAGRQASSFGPPQEHLLAWVLSKVKRSERERLLSTLPDEFARNNHRLPEVDPDFIARVKLMLGRLRARTTTPYSAAVRVTYHLEDGDDGDG